MFFSQGNHFTSTHSDYRFPIFVVLRMLFGDSDLVNDELIINRKKRHTEIFKQKFNRTSVYIHKQLA